MGLKLPNFREFKILNFWGYLLPEFGEFITQLRNLKNFNSPNVIKAFIPISGDLNPPIQGHFQVLIFNQIFKISHAVFGNLNYRFPIISITFK